MRDCTLLSNKDRRIFIMGIEVYIRRSEYIFISDNMLIILIILLKLFLI